LDLLDLKSCPTGRFVVYLLINWRNYTKFQGKVNEKVAGVSGSQPPEAMIIENRESRIKKGAERFDRLTVKTGGRNSKNSVLTGTENGVKLGEHLWRGNTTKILVLY
jgi:hypothetical protein